MVKFRRESDKKFVKEATGWIKSNFVGGSCWGCNERTLDKLTLKDFYPKPKFTTKHGYENVLELEKKFRSAMSNSERSSTSIWPERKIWFCSKCRTEMEAKKASDYAAEQARKIEEEKAEAAAKKAAEEARVVALAAAKKKAEAEAAAKKAAEEARALKRAAQKSQQEAKAERSAERQSMVKAGIPARIVALWVDGILTKSEMFKMLQVFGDKLPAWDRELAQISEPNAKPDQGRGDTIICPEFMSQIENIDDRVVLLHELISEFPSDMVKFTFTKSMTKEQLDFLKKCTKEDDLYNLYLAIVNQGFDIDFAAKLVNDCGYENNTEALQEVIDGANWEAVAVKHGFFQI